MVCEVKERERGLAIPQGQRERVSQAVDEDGKRQRRIIKVQGGNVKNIAVRCAKKGSL